MDALYPNRQDKLQFSGETESTVTLALLTMPAAGLKMIPATPILVTIDWGNVNNKLCFQPLSSSRTPTPRNISSNPRWRSKAARERFHAKVLGIHNNSKDVSRQRHLFTPICVGLSEEGHGDRP